MGFRLLPFVKIGFSRQLYIDHDEYEEKIMNSKYLRYLKIKILYINLISKLYCI